MVSLFHNKAFLAMLTSFSTQFQLANKQFYYELIQSQYDLEVVKEATEE
ncbi:hypothetical protein EZS27_000752 [termite gut metagenome]|uniref:Uncharacterized protein n=1 Tax=termite gut metagenome TaxID=433724 RepID=A0A5J4T3B1_9ZZZZ